MSEFWRYAILHSAIIAVCVTSLSALMAVPLAWLVERTNLPGAKLFDRVISFPYVLPSYLLAIAWITLANPSVGWLNLAGRALFGIENWINIYKLWGIVFIESTALMPIIYLSFKAGLRQLSPSLEEAGRLSGARPFQVLLRITVPVLKNTLLASLIAVALASLASFGVPAMIGGPGRIFVLTTGLYSLVKQGSAEALRQSFEVAAFMGLFALGFVALSQRLSRKKSAVVGGSSTRPSLVDLGTARYPLAWGLGLVWFLAVGLPLTALVLSSFQTQAGSLDPASFGLKTWHYVLFELPDFQRAITNSLVTALFASVAVVLFSLLIALLAWRAHAFRKNGSLWAARLLEGASTLAYSTPGTVVALALLFAFAYFPQLGLANTLSALIVAYTIKYLLLGLKTVEPATFLVHPSLIEAAQLSGAGTLRRLWQIWVPLLRPALFAASLLVFMPVLSELTMSILLSGPGTENLGVLLFTLQEYADRGSAAVIGTLLLIALSLFDLIARRVIRES